MNNFCKKTYKLCAVTVVIVCCLICFIGCWQDKDPMKRKSFLNRVIIYAMKMIR